jgi:ketosteroid isomerase-like protein
MTETNPGDCGGPVTAREIFDRHLRLLLDKDMQGWAELFAEDARFELPFSPAGYPKSLDGRAAIRDYIRDYPDHIDLHDFVDVAVHQTDNPNVLIAEMRAEGRVVATGKPYRMRYISVITIKDGQIANFRDYWNPLTAIEALGGEQALRDAFAAPEA